MPKHATRWAGSGLRTPLRGSGGLASAARLVRRLHPPWPPLCKVGKGARVVGRTARRFATRLCNAAHRSDHWRVRPSPPQTPPLQGGEGRAGRRAATPSLKAARGRGRRSPSPRPSRGGRRAEERRTGVSRAPGARPPRPPDLPLQGGEGANPRKHAKTCQKAATLCHVNEKATKYGNIGRACSCARRSGSRRGVGPLQRPIGQK
jgi:hypothetical protein